MDPVNVSKYGHTRFWAVRDASDELICVCVYKRGALEVARRLSPSGADVLREMPPEPGREPVRALPNPVHVEEQPGRRSQSAA
jgi:hypothetical protein